MRGIIINPPPNPTRDPARPAAVPIVKDLRFMCFGEGEVVSLEFVDFILLILRHGWILHWTIRRRWMFDVIADRNSVMLGR